MTARLFDSRLEGLRLRVQVARDVERFEAMCGRPPGLATVLIGEDEASAIYVGAKQRACREVGPKGVDPTRLWADVSADEVLSLLDELNEEPEVSGILCQCPQLLGRSAVAIDRPSTSLRRRGGRGRNNAGRPAAGRAGLRPCTPAGVMLLLEAAGAALEGAHAVVIGRSNPVRQADGPNALGRKRDGHHVSLTHARPAADVPPGGRARSGGRDPASRAGRLGEAGRGGHR